MGRPHGLDGAFVVERPSDDPRRLAVGSKLLVAGVDVEIVLSRRVGGRRLAIKLDRTGRARRAAHRPARRPCPSPIPATTTSFELVGLEAIEQDGRSLGRVHDVHAGAANDNLELEDGSLVPMIEDAIVSVDVDGGRIVQPRLHSLTATLLRPCDSTSSRRFLMLSAG